MVMWNAKSGEIVDHVVIEDEIWSVFNAFFSDTRKKTSTYKYGFLKAILDNLFSVEVTALGMELTFSQLFGKFAENYWNLIMKYHLRQMSNNGKSAYSSIEKIFYEAAEQNNMLSCLEYSSLSVTERQNIIKKVQQACKKYVVGALYSDFEGKFYGFDLKEGKIWVSTVFYAFLLKYKLEIERANYFAWAKMLENINADNPTSKLLDKLELSTPKRNNLSCYRDILQREFEEYNCFYCGKKLKKEIHVDHVIPWQLVREDRLWNFVLACPSCNISKNNRLPSKKAVEIIVQRNEVIKASDFYAESSELESEFNNYTKELLPQLWQYAKMGGFREWARI